MTSREELYYQIATLEQENKQLKDNWNELKDYLLGKHDYKCDEIWLKMKEIEGENNE